MQKAPIYFKGIAIEPLTYSRRALMLSIVNVKETTFMEVATAIYCAICPRKELIAATGSKEAFTAKVADWIDKVEFDVSDADEAAKVLGQLIGDSKENEVEPILAADFSEDPDTGDGLGKQ